MGKAAHDDVIDGLGDVIIAAADKQILCSSQPTTYAEATTTYALADIAIDGTDFSQANGDTNGRKTTIAAQNGVSVDTSGTAQHVALVDDTASKLLYVTTCTSQAVTAGNTVNFPAWDIEVADPT